MSIYISIIECNTIEISSCDRPRLQGWIRCRTILRLELIERMVSAYVLLSTEENRTQQTRILNCPIFKNQMKRISLGRGMPNIKLQFHLEDGIRGRIDSAFVSCNVCII